jgi:hypothetical protein
MDEVEKDDIKALFKDTKKGQAEAEKAIDMLEKMEKKARCTWPLNQFYLYEEDVPKDTRISTPEDCEKCADKYSCGDGRYCLITECPNEEPEREKKCEGKCPYCGSVDIDYGESYNVADNHYHQRCACNDCNHCFIEVSEIVYRSTLLSEEKA